MRYKLPGPTGLRVWELSLGTMSFGDTWGFGADPLQPGAQAWVASRVHDPWLVRHLPGLLDQAGFALMRQRSFGYAETSDARYMPTIVDRGADALVAADDLGAEAATALKAEARRRAATGEFFGDIAYASLVSRRWLQ